MPLPDVATVVLAAGEAPPDYLVQTSVLVLAAALIGYVSVRVRVVPIVGFLLAGVIIGPYQLGLVERAEAVESAAEIGVILLLFTIGIEFSLARLARISRWIFLGGGAQVVLTIGLTTVVLLALDVGWREALFTGFLLSLSSTAIVLKLLGDAGETSGTRGQLSLAMLIFQDLAVIVMVLLVPLLADPDDAGGDPTSTPDLLVALLKAAGIIVVVLVAARRLMPPILERVARTCSPEVFLLAVLAICMGTAYLTALAGVSVSLGAFLAGLIVSESRHSAHAFGEIMPLQIIFSAVFFVSVGMLLDLGFVMDHLGLVLGAVALTLVVKVLATLAAGAVTRVATGTALGTALLLAQIGEFSFVLQTTGADEGLSPFGQGADGAQAFIAATVLLMVLGPVLAAAGRVTERRLVAGDTRRTATAMAGELPEGAASAHIVLSGWGPVARSLGHDLTARGIAVTVTTLNPDGAREAEEDGHTVVRGDPTKLPVLQAAGALTARVVVIAEDDAETAARIASVVSSVSNARVVVRPVGVADLEELAAAGAHKVVDRDAASARELTRSVLAECEGAAPTSRDTSRLIHFPVPVDSGCVHGSVVRPVLPSAPGCEDCLRLGETWVHLRVCLTCGYAGCCDSSPRRHARAHAGAEDHPLIATLEPGEDWAYCFEDSTTITRTAPGRSPVWSADATVASQHEETV